MNIFARELSQLLKRYDKNLGSLYGLHSATYQLPPNKVTRLKLSLMQDITATLNAEELELLAKWLKLSQDGEEIRRLRAALIAEGVRHLLGGRMNRDQAFELGELTFKMLLDQRIEEVQTQREELLEKVRGGKASKQGESNTDPVKADEQNNREDNTISPIDQSLETAVKTYEQGALWLVMAYETSDRSTQLGYLAQAKALLGQAYELTSNAPPIVLGTAAQKEWLNIIENSLTEATSLRWSTPLLRL